MEETLKWIDERLQYIAANCDLEDKDNKRAYESLKFAKERLEEDEAVIKEMINYIGMNTNVEIKKCPFREDSKCKDKCKNCIEYYFRKKVQDERNKV